MVNGYAVKLKRTAMNRTVANDQLLMQNRGKAQMNKGYRQSDDCEDDEGKGNNVIEVL